MMQTSIMHCSNTIQNENRVNVIDQTRMIEETCFENTGIILCSTRKLLRLSANQN